MTRNMAEITRMTQGMPPWGARLFLPFPFAGLNFAIPADGITATDSGMQELELMSRRKWMWLALALGACGRNAPLPADFFPERVANVWRRTASRNLPVSEAPDPVPRTSVERLQVAAYEGPGKIEARVYELSRFEVGLDLAQRWRPSADTVFFQQGRYFVVVKWQQADREALQEFVRELGKRLPAAKPR